MQIQSLLLYEALHWLRKDTARRNVCLVLWSYKGGDRALLLFFDTIELGVGVCQYE